MIRHAVVLLALVTPLSGCGTLFERAENRRPTTEYYQGVKYDWRLLTLQGRGGYDFMPTACYLTLFCPFGMVLILPLDFVVDTVALPFDYQAIQRYERGLQTYIRQKYCHGSQGPEEQELARFG